MASQHGTGRASHPAEAAPRALVRRWLPLCGFAALVLFAFAFNFQVARRGCFPLDQAIVFDGAYRIHLGQVPYRDFLLPVGPIAFVLQAAYFQLFGVGYGSYLVNASLNNAIATAVVYYILRRGFPSLRSPAYLGGLATAVWFCPPFGTPWLEQTAFFFATLSLGAIVASCGRFTFAWLLTAGALAALAVLSKQNAGLFSFAFLLPPLLLAHSQKARTAITALFAFGVGMAIVALSFHAWLLTYSDVDLFWRYAFELPAEEGTNRLGYQLERTITKAIVGGEPRVCVLAAQLSIGFAGAALLAAALRRQLGNRVPHVEAAVYTAACLAPVAQNLFIYSTRNQPEQGCPLIGFIVGVGLAAVWRLPSILERAAGDAAIVKETALSRRRWRALWLATGTLAMATTYVSVLALGTQVAFDRRVHDYFRGTRFTQHCDVPLLDWVYWSDYNSSVAGRMSSETVELVHEALRRRDEPLVVLTDFMFLYPMLGQAPPQPLVWFHAGLTYPSRYDPALDQWIVDDLERHGVQVAVIVHGGFENGRAAFSRLPKLAAYVRDNFHLSESIGPFEIHDRVKPATTGGAAEGPPSPASHD